MDIVVLSVPYQNPAGLSPAAALGRTERAGAKPAPRAAIAVPCAPLRGAAYAGAASASSNAAEPIAAGSQPMPKLHRPWPGQRDIATSHLPVFVSACVPWQYKAVRVQSVLGRQLEPLNGS